MAVTDNEERISHGSRRQDQERCRGRQGQGKEAAGKATNDEQLQAEGQADQSKADLKNAGEKVKDAFKN